MSKVKKICLCCLMEVQTNLICTNCRVGRYCSKQCQLKHWPVHKNSCKNSNIEDSLEKLQAKATNSFNQGNAYDTTGMITNIIIYR